MKPICSASARKHFELFLGVSSNVGMLPDAASRVRWCEPGEKAE